MKFIARQLIAVLFLTGICPLVSIGQVEIPAELQQEEQRRIKTIAESKKATVCVFGTGGQGGGSGVVISSDGYALTNFHVVQGNGPFMKCSMPDGRLYDSVLVGIDPTGDVALIKLLGRKDFPAAVIGDSDQLQVGQWCFAIGNPFLLATNFEPSVSWGLISGVHRYQYPAGTLLEYADCIQTDAAINPGNSGGALFNAKGQLVGINGRGSFEKRGRVNVGVGYAISINQIMHFLSHLKSGRLVDHATLGATVATNELGEVRVSNIVESSDAYRQGLRYDDQIISFAGREVSTVNQFKNILGIFPKGWRVPIVIQRSGETFQFVASLTGVHSQHQLNELIQGASDSDETPDPNPKPTDEPEIDNVEKDYGLVDANDAALYEERRGYANYWFNRQQRDEIWTKSRSHGDFSIVNQKWRITANINGEKSKLILSDETSGLQIEDDACLLDYKEMPNTQLAPNKTGLLLAMHLWRKMLIVGPKNYGETTYFGEIPLFLTIENQLTDLGNVNCVVATTDVIETNFLFGTENSQLIAMEVFPDVDVDPTVLHFADYQTHDDLTVPGTIRVFANHKQVMTIRIDQIEFLKSITEEE